MKYWEIESDLHGHVRIEWNQSATFNLQTPVGGQWVDFHCFTCYNIENEQAALSAALEILGDLE